MTKRIAEILKRLDEAYGTEYVCYLNHETPWQLLIAVILSAQCTDARVNIVTKDLFQKYPSLEAFANADLKELEQDIHSTGFYHNKAKNIISCARTLVEKYDGEVPRELEELTALAGVGRKTANVIRGNIYHEPSVVVDTHVKRISKKLGFTKEDDPVKIEYDLMKVLPKTTGSSTIYRSSRLAEVSVLHGIRNVPNVFCQTYVREVENDVRGLLRH